LQESLQTILQMVPKVTLPEVSAGIGQNVKQKSLHRIQKQ